MGDDSEEIELAETVVVTETDDGRERVQMARLGEFPESLSGE